MTMLKNWFRKQKPIHDEPKPPKYHGLSILGISDTHSRSYELPDVKPDIVVLLGDISREGVLAIDQAYECLKFGVRGNHDRSDYYSGTSIVNLHGTTVKTHGITIGGFGGVPRYNGKAYGQYTEDQVCAFMDRLKYVDLFIAHANPRRADRPDLIRHAPYAGFACFADYIKRMRPEHFFHGHIHEVEDYAMSSTMVHSVYGIQRFDV